VVWTGLGSERLRVLAAVALLAGSVLAVARPAVPVAALDAPTTGRIAYAGTQHRSMGVAPVTGEMASTDQPLFGAGPAHFDDQPFARGGGLVFTSRRDEPRPQLYLRTAAGTVRRLTTGMDVADPELSVDGRTAVFDSATAGQRDLWAIGTDGTGLRRLTGSPADETAPTLSPDGTQVAYASDVDGGSRLFRQPVAGGPPTRVSDVDGVSEPEWDPVAALDRIAFTQNGNRLMLVPAGGGAPAPMLVGAQANWQASGLSWLPDGIGYVFLSPNCPCSDVVLDHVRVYQGTTQPADQTPVGLLDEDRLVGCPTLLVTPTGPAVLVARTTGPDPVTATLQDIRPDGADPRDLGQPILREDPRADPTGDPLFNPGPGFDPWTVRQDYSPDGTRLAFSRFDTVAGQRVERIWLANADGSDAAVLPIADRAPGDWETDAAWSPDGTRLAIARRSPGGLPGQGGQSRIIVVDMATGAVVDRVPAAAGLDDAQPAFSARGLLAFTRQRAGGGKHVLVAPVGDLGAASDLSAAVCGADCDVVDDSPAFSPDGSQVAVNRKDDAVLLAAPSGAGCRVLLPAGASSCAGPITAPDGPFQPRDVAFAPDGRTVALTSRRTADPSSPESLSIVDLATRVVTSITSDLPGRQKEPAFQPAPPPTSAPPSSTPPPATTPTPVPPPAPARPAPPADPGVGVTATPVPGFVGGRVTVTLTVRNRGRSPATNVALVLRLPAFPLDSIAGCAATGCPLGTVEPGSSRLVRLVFAPVAAGTGTLTGTVTTDGSDAVRADDSATIRLRVVQPRIIAVPAIGKPGFVTLVRGVDFPPAVPVRLTWTPGITVAAAPAFPAAAGRFTAQLLILGKDQTGPRVITATGPGFSPVTTPFLVVVGTIGPPTDTERR
jgi:dipeptidyl aminopeptidase/acylaminoacyl peptidase